MKSFDALVVGSGPAGLSAALYLARFGKSVALVEKLAAGGLLLQTVDIENYPGFPKGIKGYELADAFSAQLEPYTNLTRIRGEIYEMRLSGPEKRILVDNEWLTAKTLVVCSGVKYRKLGLPGEDALLGKGLSHCALCDGNFFRGQRVGVVGGGNSALEESAHLAELASELYLFHRRSEFRGAPLYLERLERKSNVHIERGTIVTSLHGGANGLEGVTIKRLDSGRDEYLPLDGLFIFVGFDPVNYFLPEELEKDEKGFLKTDSEMRTNVPGVFAAGDVRSKLCRQVVTAVGDGATAANSAYIYLEQQHG